jgi:Domain of unknown function (DUF4271)
VHKKLFLPLLTVFFHILPLVSYAVNKGIGKDSYSNRASYLKMEDTNRIAKDTNRTSRDTGTTDKEKNIYNGANNASKEKSDHFRKENSKDSLTQSKIHDSSNTANHPEPSKSLKTRSNGNILTDRRYPLAFTKERIQEYTHLLKGNGDKMGILETSIPRNTRSVWILTFILLIIVLLTIIKVQFPIDLRNLNQSLFRDRLIRDDRELGFLKSPTSIFVLLAFCLSSALLVYFYFRDQKIESVFSGIQLYLVISLGILIFFMVKIFLLLLIGFIFQAPKLIQSYLSLNYMVMTNFTLVIMPFLLLYALVKSNHLPYLMVWIPFLVLLFLVFLFSVSCFCGYKLSTFLFLFISVLLCDGNLPHTISF